MKEISNDGFIGGNANMDWANEGYGKKPKAKRSASKPKKASKPKTKRASSKPKRTSSKPKKSSKKVSKKKGGENSIVSALKSQIKPQTVLPSNSELGLNARKYANDIARAYSNQGRNWDMTQTTGTNTLLGRRPVEVLEGEELPPRGYTGTATAEAEALMPSQANSMVNAVRSANSLGLTGRQRFSNLARNVGREDDVL